MRMGLQHMSQTRLCSVTEGFVRNLRDEATEKQMKQFFQPILAPLNIDVFHCQKHRRPGPPAMGSKPITENYAGDQEGFARVTERELTRIRDKEGLKLPLGRYRYARESEPETDDRTSFLKAQRNWGFTGDNRSQYPPILFILRRGDRPDPHYPDDGIPPMRVAWPSGCGSQRSTSNSSI